MSSLSGTVDVSLAASPVQSDTGLTISDGSFTTGSYFDTQALDVNSYSVSYTYHDYTGTNSNGSYTVAFDTVDISGTLTVTPATPNLSLSVTGITYGTVLTDSQLMPSTATWTVGTATETVSGTFAFASLSVARRRRPSETVTFTPTDSTDYATATGTVTVNVNPATPNLSLSATGITYGTVLTDSQLSASTAWTVGSERRRRSPERSPSRRWLLPTAAAPARR